MNDADIKEAVKTVHIHHELGWWVAMIPDIGVATQAKTLSELGVEVERIIVAHFETAHELGVDPFRCKQLSAPAITAKALDGWDHATRAFSGSEEEEAEIVELRKQATMLFGRPTTP